MWTLIRIAGLALLVVVAVLLSGHGDWLLDALGRAARPTGLGPLPGDAAALTPGMVTAGLLAGLLAAMVRPVDRVMGQLVTLLHELGHTVVAASLGARPAGIVLRHDASGHATARWLVQPGPARRLSLAATAFVGLPAPAVAAAAGVGLLLTAGPRAVLWSLAAAGALVALLARSLWSLVVALVFMGAAVAGLSQAAEPWVASAVVALLAGVAIRSATHAANRLRRPIPAGDDARAVHRHLRLPPRLVQVAQVAATVAAAAWAGWPLVEVAAPELGAVPDLGGANGTATR